MRARRGRGGIAEERGGIHRIEPAASVASTRATNGISSAFLCDTSAPPASHYRFLLAPLLLAATLAWSQPIEPVLSQAKAQREPFLATLKELVEIESGSVDREGLDRIADVVAARLRALDGNVEILEPAVAEVTRPDGTKVRPGRMVRATYTGKGSRKVLLIAHMDTVYARGMLAKQPFRVEGDKVYGLGIADDKQGVALIIHAVAMLRALEYPQIGILTVLINGDEEIGSPGSRKLITELGSTHDAVMSFEASDIAKDHLSLTTAGIGTVRLKIQGRASHAGVSPELGVNALYELAHQVLQMRDLSDPATGMKLNWTLARAGTNLNVVPPEAEATADVRVLRLDHYDIVEKRVRERIATKLLPEANVDVTFTRGRPPLAMTPASRSLAVHAQKIYREVGEELAVEEEARGGGTDAAYASLQAKGAVVERFGMKGYGGHSAYSEYVSLANIEPRLYLTARTVMDLMEDKVK